MCSAECAGSTSSWNPFPPSWRPWSRRSSLTSWFLASPATAKLKSRQKITKKKDNGDNDDKDDWRQWGCQSSLTTWFLASQAKKNDKLAEKL